jgi:hypothetical protein
MPCRQHFRCFKGRISNWSVFPNGPDDSYHTRVFEVEAFSEISLLNNVRIMSNRSTVLRVFTPCSLGNSETSVQFVPRCIVLLFDWNNASTCTPDTFTVALFSSSETSKKIYYAKKRFSVTSNLWYAWSIKCR